MSSFPLTNSINFQDGHIAPPTSHPFSDSLMRISSFPELVLPRSSPGHPRPQMFSSSGLYISVHLYHRFNKTIAIISVLFLPQVTAPNFHLKRGDPGETQIFSVPRQWPQLYDGGFKMVQIKCIKMCHPLHLVYPGMMIRYGQRPFKSLHGSCSSSHSSMSQGEPPQFEVGL